MTNEINVCKKLENGRLEVLYTKTLYTELLEDDDTGGLKVMAKLGRNYYEVMGNIYMQYIIVA